MKRAFILILTLAFCAFPALAQTDETGEGSTGPSGLPLPRFASLRADEVNLRTGPGTRYPIEWVFRKDGLPVEIVAEFDVWRRIKDSEGSLGWVHKSTLSGRRTLIVEGGPSHDVRKKPDSASPAVAHVEPGAIGRLKSCREIWCEVAFENIEGYMKKEDFWGAYPQETFR